jgi:antitoxin component YwqK of YwqJK toxin-antitoxin module
MKLISLLLAALTSLTAFSQADTTLVYLNNNNEVVAEHRASGYAIQYKEHDLWKRIVYDKYTDRVLNAGYYSSADYKTKEGPYNEFHRNGKISSGGRFANGKKTGMWKGLDADGKLLDSAFYKDGLIQGLSLRWNADGFITDSLLFEEGGNGYAKGFRPGGIIRYQGKYVAGKKAGPWTYYYPAGTKSQDVTYEADSAVRFTCFDLNGNLQTKDCFYEKEAEFQGGTEGWTRFLMKNLDANVPVKKKAREGSYTAIVRFIVTKDCTIQNIEAETNHGYGMEQEVIRIIKKGPKWVPAIQYNRPVNAYRRQPVTFVISGN